MMEYPPRSSAMPAPAHALCDHQGWLREADEPLAELQRRCGGTIPGVIAIPALAELVRLAHRYGLHMGRAISAQDGEHAIRCWVDIVPATGEESQALTRMTFHGWQLTRLLQEDAEDAAERRTAIDRALADFTANLDARQAVLAAVADCADLAGLAERMRAGFGRAWTDFVTLPGSAHHQPLHWRLLDGAKVVVDGSSRSFRAVLLPLGDRTHEPTGFELLLLSDEPALEDTRSSLPSIDDRARDDAGQPLLGREIAPVLRQPITRIIASAESIRTRLAGPLDDEYSRYAGDIAEAGRHLLELIDDLADLEAVEAENFTTAQDSIDLADVVRRAAGLLSIRARERGIVLVVPDEGAQLAAVAEYRRVLQVLLNLLGNAIRYAPEGSRVELRLEEGQKCSLVHIVDEGSGLTDDQKSRVFDRFERLGRSGDGGTGLGLYISRRLARAMGGDLTVSDAPGTGACFTLSIPDSIRSAS